MRNRSQCTTFRVLYGNQNNHIKVNTMYRQYYGRVWATWISLGKAACYKEFSQRPTARQLRAFKKHSFKELKDFVKEK